MNRVLTIVAALLISLTQANAKIWQAEWISSPTASEQSNSWFCFHKSVVIDDLGDKPAFADIAVDSKYWLWINGQMVVFEGGLKRGPSPENTYYDHVDITRYLHKGENTTALLVWHFGKEGFAPKEYYPAILKVLKREHHASPYMEKYVGEALFKMGYADYALQRTRERFDKMVNHPTLTTLWEGWGIGSEGFGGGSTNHAWSGGTLTLLSQYVAGISPIKPGFKEFRIAPQMGNLSNAIASVETPYGTIRVSVLCVNDVMNINFEVPTGTVAHITKRGKDETFGAGSHHIRLSRE